MIMDWNSSKFYKYTIFRCTTFLRTTGQTVHYSLNAAPSKNDVSERRKKGIRVTKKAILGRPQLQTQDELALTLLNNNVSL